jgi:hypothetical protein
MPGTIPDSPLPVRLPPRLARPHIAGYGRGARRNSRVLARGSVRALVPAMDDELFAGSSPSWFGLQADQVAVGDRRRRRTGYRVRAPPLAKNAASSLDPLRVYARFRATPTRSPTIPDTTTSRGLSVPSTRSPRRSSSPHVRILAEAAGDPPARGERHGGSEQPPHDLLEKVAAHGSEDAGHFRSRLHTAEVTGFETQ